MISRRKFVTFLGGTAAQACVAWPLAVQAQQQRMPVIGLLNGASNEAYADRIAAIRRGLREVGFMEGQNMAIEYRSADGQYDRLSTLAADLVRRQVAVMVAIGSTRSALAAKAATSTIPIVFATGGDAVASGLVKSFSRPEANVTGISFDQMGLDPKRLELMSELLPNAQSVGFLDNPASAPDRDDIKMAALSLGRDLAVFGATNEQEVDAAFASMVVQKIAALVVSSDAQLNAYRDRIIKLAAHHAIATVYANREYVRAGGFASYGVELSHLYRLAGVYAGRDLRGDKPSDLPVMLPTKYEMVINNKTAKALGIDVPLALLIRVDEVID